jgi:hypothetical protein
MRLWRLTRTAHTALDRAGTSKHGGRYSPPGAPVVNFTSEAGLAVLVALRYLPADPAGAPDEYLLGWTEIDAVPERVPSADGDAAIRAWVTDWLAERRSLLAAVRSQVLPEADVVLMNPLHPGCRPGTAARHAPVQFRRVPPHSADSRSELEAIDVRVVRAEPVAKRGRRHPDSPERLVRILEQHLSVPHPFR